MKYATVGDLISALQKMPLDAPVFGYSEMDECDYCIEVVELYTPEEKREEPTDESSWLFYLPPHYCKGDSFISEYWRENKQISPVVYIRESTYTERCNDEECEEYEEHKGKKENAIYLTDI